MTSRAVYLYALLSAVAVVGCGLVPQRVSHDDPRLKPLFEAIAEVDRAALGFTPIAPEAKLRVEWRARAGYDVMLHVDGRTGRTIAFRRRTDGRLEWIGEQERFPGPDRYKTVDGEFNEEITLTFEKERISGHPLNVLNITYSGDDPELEAATNLTLERVRPWLKRWGY